MVFFILITGGTFFLMCGIASLDNGWGHRFSWKGNCAVAAICTAWGAGLKRWGKIPFVDGCFLCVIAGCLFMACMTDWRERLVYRFVWWIGGAAAVLLLFWRLMWRTNGGRAAPCGDIWVLALYILVQQVLFGRMYGRADCHAFCICAAVQTAFGSGFQDYLLHMASAFLGLALVQSVRGNIASDGNLKKPVPFVPYIAASFWLWVDFAAGK